MSSTTDVLGRPATSEKKKLVETVATGVVPLRPSPFTPPRGEFNMLFQPGLNRPVGDWSHARTLLVSKFPLFPDLTPV